MSGAQLGTGVLSDVAFMFVRASVGAIFIAHGVSKVGNEGFVGWMGSVGIPPEVAALVIVAEIVPGVVILFGVLSRASAGVLAAVMAGAIFQIKGASSLTGDGGYELDLILLAACLAVAVAGPGRVSAAHLVKRLPRALH